VVVASAGSPAAKPKTLITTPLPRSAKRLKSGAAAVAIGDIEVIIKPDHRTVSTKLQNRAETKFHISTTAATHAASGGTVTSLKPPKVTITIQTVYGPGVDATSPSAYGKGSTLGDHEGSHGTDFLTYLRTNPFPAFGGAIGMTLAEFGKANADYAAAVKEYSRLMDAYSTEKTDCTGTSKAPFCP
jgi:hypothetical protein